MFTYPFRKLFVHALAFQSASSGWKCSSQLRHWNATQPFI